MTYDEQMEKESSERDALMQKFLVENGLTWHFVHNWVTDKGYVIVLEDEYENMEIIDNDSPNIP